MSLTIREGKMCFSVFGRGYDDTRSDSGDGAIEEYDRFAMGICSGCFDKTGQYLWLGCYGNGHTAGLLKYDMDDDFNELVHSVPTGATATVVFHAPNSDNNLGLAIQGANWWVFDLTDDTVVASGSDASIANYIDWARTPFDVVLRDTTFYICQPRRPRGIKYVMALNYDSGSFSAIQLSGFQRSGGSFINDSLIYLYYPAEWNWSNDYISGVSTGTSEIWGYQTTGVFSNVQLMGFGRKGRLYVPSFVYGSWRLGEYNGTRVPDFETPKPVKLIGKFASKPTIADFQFSHEQKHVGINTDIGTFVSNFEDTEKIIDAGRSVFAVNDKYLVVDMGYWDSARPSSIGIYKYR